MNDPRERDTKHRKKPYVKPTVSRVQLKAEEAVLGNCKTAGSGGPIQATCTSPASCSAIAS
jgi:hypothetical protein